MQVFLGTQALNQPPVSSYAPSSFIPNLPSSNCMPQSTMGQLGMPNLPMPMVPLPANNGAGPIKADWTPTAAYEAPSAASLQAGAVMNREARVMR